MRLGPEQECWLNVGGKCVAWVAPRIDLGWVSVLTRHKPSRMWKSARRANQAQGRQRVDRWCAKHSDRLRREPDGFANPWAREPVEG